MSKFSVKKPLTVLVAVIIVLVLGVVSVTKMTPDLMPNIDMPYVIVMTTYPGATPEEVEQNLTKPLEQAMGTLENIDEISSTSSANYSMVVMQFTSEVNMDTISVDILQKINGISDQWDDTIGTPYILKMNPSMMPVSVAAVNMEGKSAAELSSFMDDTLMNQLEGIAGVASVTASGSIDQSVNVVLSQKKINALNKKIQKAIDNQFSDGEQQLADGQSQVESGKAELESGKTELEQGKEQLANQTAEAGTQLNEKQSEIDDGKAQINAQLSSMEAQLAELEQQESKLQETQSTITQLESSKKELTETIHQLKELKTTVASLEKAESQFKSQIELINKNDNLSDSEKEAAKQKIYESDEYRQTVAGLAAIDAQLAAMGSDRNGIDSLITQSQEGLTTVNNGLNTIDSSLAEMGMKRSDVSNALNEITSGKTQIQQAKQQLNATLEQLNSGEIQVKQAMENLEKQKTKSIFQLSDASTKLLLGESTLNASAKEIDSGLEQLEQAKTQTHENADLTNIITMDTVSKLLAAQNFSMPAGYVEEDGVQYLVSVGDKITSEKDLNDLVLLDLNLDGIDPIRLSDVADSFITDNSDSVYANINGEDGILLTFSKQSNYATADVSNHIQEKFDELSKEYEGLTFTSLMDQGDYIYSIIGSILQSLILGAVFAIIILFLFLRDIKPTFIILCSIPISVIFAFVLMYFSGVTLNMISMSGLAIAVGMLVDNSVVVIENIYRLRNKGVSAIKSAIIGASQVAAAIASSTLTTICVFLPIVFVEGITRQLFTDMALTMGYALMASLIVALTLVPAMSSRMLRNTKPKSHKWFDKMLNGYEKSLRWALRFKPVVLIFAVVLLVGSGALAMAKGFVFMPETTVTELTLELEMPETAVLADTRKTSDEAVKRIREIEDVDTVGAMLASKSGMLGSMMGSDNTSVRNVTFYITLKDGVHKTTTELTNEILDACSDLDGEMKESSTSMTSSMMGGLSDSSVDIRVYGEDLDALQSAAKLVAEQLTMVEGTKDISDGIEDTEPEIHLIVNKKKAMKYGLTVAQVYQKVSEALNMEATATNVSYDGNDYDVVIQKKKATSMTPDQIRNYKFTVEQQDGTKKTVKLSKIAEIINTETLSSIKRVDQKRYIDVSAKVDSDHNISLVTEDAKKQLENLELPSGCRIEFDGGNEDIMASMKDLVQMLLLGVLLVYLIMVAQFQSLKHPFIVMFTIPLAFTGGLLALLVTGMEISVISMMGFVMLCGIIVNNGIVLVDYINQLRLAGMQKREAIVDAGKTRMRPILMTTITTILGLLVMALGIGSGNEMMQPVAVVCIGGLIYATLLTLYVIPVIYDLMNRKDLKRLKKEDLDIINEKALDLELAALEAKQGKHTEQVLPEAPKETTDKTEEK